MDCLRVLSHRCSWHAVPIDFTFASREHRIKRREKLISKLIQEVARRATFFRRIKPRDFIPFIRGLYRECIARARVCKYAYYVPTIFIIRLFSYKSGAVCGRG